MGEVPLEEVRGKGRDALQRSRFLEQGRRARDHGDAFDRLPGKIGASTTRHDGRDVAREE